MTPQRWQRIKDILAGALERVDRDDRATFVADACAGDADLQAEVETFFAAEDESIEHYVTGVAAQHPTQDTTTPVGRRIGSYELVREVGRGGMGVVWLAQRADQRFEQQVAVKLLKRGTDTEEVLRRFHAERRILARLEHPGIARLFDAGETDDGLPYFVMEYVEGVPITDYARTHQLSVVQRLELFRLVCGAVSYAHRNLVIHRDLKPANTLVTAEGDIKLLDFGIAKLVQEAGENVLAPTVSAQRVLTPEYASPEQLHGENITTVSDVYSLGIILYELLAGTRPDHVKSRNAKETARALTTEPARPSTTFTRAELTPASAKAERKCLRGDIDNIVLKALRHDPQRRYGSVNQMSEDIRRHFAGLPVLARPDTPLYRSSKFVQRHKLGVASAALVVIALIAGTITTAWEAHHARSERAIAQRRFNEVRRLTNSYLFEIHDAIRDLPGSTTARQLIVTRALEYLDRLAGESAGDRTLQLELANAYLKVGDVQGRPYTANLGDSAGALHSYTKAAEITEPLAVKEQGTSITARRLLAQAGESLGVVQSRLHRWEQATVSHQRSIALREQLLKDNPAETAEWQRGIVANDIGLGDAVVSANRVKPAADYQRIALAYYRRALPIAENLLAAQPRDETASSLLAKVCARIAIELSELGADNHDPAAYGESATFHLRAIALDEAIVQADPANAAMRRNLADELIALSYLRAFSGEELPAALEGCRRAQAIMETLAASDSANAEAQQDLSTVNYVTARVLQAQGNRAGAADSYRHCLTVLEPLVAAHPDNVETSFDLERARKGLAEVAGAGP